MTTDTRKRNTDGSPMIQYPSMTGSVARNNPASVTGKKFSKDQLAHAKKLLKMFGDDVDKNWIQGSQFANDPIIIQAILDFDQTLKMKMDDLGLNSMTENPQMAHRLVRDLQGRFSSELMRARSDWIEQNGPISNDMHPADDYQRDLRRAEGLDENTGRPRTPAREELVSTIKEAMSDE